MYDKTVEQAENTASKIGKFNTAEDLLAAYNALESEFTKRCQLVKQLQTELNALRAQAQVSDREQDTKKSSDIADFDGKDGVDVQSDSDLPVPEVDKDKETSVDLPSEPVISADDVLNEILQNACEYAEALSAVPEIMSACIASYKQRLLKPHPATAPKGCAVIVPAKKPRTLSEAKRLADALLSGN